MVLALRWVICVDLRTDSGHCCVVPLGKGAPTLTLRLGTEWNYTTEFPH
jgi:hypothetical protein